LGQAAVDAGASGAKAQTYEAFAYGEVVWSLITVPMERAETEKNAAAQALLS
jgi:hypothetical protein